MFTSLILFIFRLFNKLYEKGMIRIYLFFYVIYKFVSDYKDIKKIKSYINEGSVVIDAGANIGFYTVLFAKLVGLSGFVFAFEPNEKNFKILKNRTNKFKNVKVINAALSDKSGKLDLYISEELNVDHQTYDSGESRKKVQIDCFSLDDYCDLNGIRKVSFVKMDLQGYDAVALRGMEVTIRKNEEICICCEFWPYGMKRAGVEPEEMLMEMQKKSLVSSFQYHGEEEYGFYRTLWFQKNKNEKKSS